jgi:Zn-dependent M28 family amino/carboxypeptidase
MRSILTIAVLLLVLVAAAAQSAPRDFDGKSWWEHVKVLADDRMEGRETGSEGLRKAEAYAVEQFKHAGVQPAGSDGFYQPVKFSWRQIDEKNSSLALVPKNGAAEPLSFADDAFFSTRVDLTPDPIDAPLVFVGYGLKVPEQNYDDLAGLDLKGKIAVLISGSPASMTASLASHHQSPGERWKPFKQAGAIGTITILNPASMDIPWSRIALNRAHPAMDLADPEFNETAGQKVAITFNPAKAEKLFAGSGHTFSEIATLAKDRMELPRFPLAVALQGKASVQKKQIESANIVGKLPGRDPRLKDEYVVLSAHIDHIGIGEPINGDRIYNGAMDDGSGSALVLDMAASLKRHPEKLRRSVLFVLVTAEEKGLLGSKYFAAHPTVSVKSMVADINVDMFLPIVPLKILRVLGLNDSSLGDLTRQIAVSHNVQVQPDPEPLRNLFIRSDQYNFIKRGIPSIIMDVSFTPGSPEQKLYKDWLTQRYHAPSDDLNQPVNLGAAALYEQIIRELLLSVANSGSRPEWKSDSFFRRYAGAGM